MPSTWADMSQFGLLGHLSHLFAINPPVYPFIHLPTHPLTTYPTHHPLISSSDHLPVHLSIHPTARPLMHSSIHSCVCPSHTHLPFTHSHYIHLPIHPFTHWPYLLIRPSTFPFIYPPIQPTPISRQTQCIWVPTIYPLSERGVFPFCFF